MKSDTLSLTVDGTEIALAYLRRPGPRPPLVCLHGFGSTKEDYADLALRPDFAGRDLIMFDAPGCGASTLSDPAALSIPFLVETALAACNTMGVEKFHLSGHSMGGLTALLLAHAHPERLLSFISIEGNVAPEDCFLSRQILEYPNNDANSFLDGLVERASQRSEYALRLFAMALPLKVRPSSVEPVFASMVDISDNDPLLDMLAGLPVPRLFVHGDQNRSLSYLGDLPGLGVEVAEIPFSNHFPMYSNPVALWAVMADFLARAEDVATRNDHS